MWQCCTDEDDKVAKLANNWSKPSICGNYILLLAGSVISVGSKLRSVLRVWLQGPLKEPVSYGQWLWYSAKENILQWNPWELVPGVLLEWGGTLSAWLWSVSPLRSVWPVQHLWTVLWPLSSYLCNELRARFGTQRLRNTLLWGRFQNSLLPLERCIVPAWTGKAPPVGISLHHAKKPQLIA